MKTRRRTTWAARSAAVMLAGAMVFGGAAAAFPVTAWAQGGSSIIDGTTKKGTLTIHKKGTDAGTPLKGATFTIYKVMSLTPGTEPGEFASYEKVAAFQKILANVNPDELGNYSAQEIENLAAQLAETAKSLEDNDGQQTTNDSGDAVFSNLDLGYYLVIETSAPDGYVAGSPFLVAIPSTNNYNNGAAGTEWVYSVEASPKNSQVDIEKGLAEEGGEQDGSVAVGDFVKYQVETTIPEYPEEYFAKDVTFTIKDTMSDGLEIQKDEDHPVAVTVDNSPVAEGKDTYTVTAVNKTGADKSQPDLTVAFVKDYIKANGGKKVVLTYYAKVTEAAVIGNGGNNNHVELTYNNNPGTTTDAEAPDVKVYTFKIKVVKFTKEDGETSGEALKGAKFGLYTDEDCSTPVPGTSETETGTGGTLSFDRLDEGTYYLKETKAPAGYTLLANPIKIEIRAVKDQSNHATGNFELYVNDEKVTATSDSGQFVTQIDQAGGTATIAVENHKGFTLPATGGMGVTLFVAVGIAGIAAVSVVITRKTRKSR